MANEQMNLLQKLSKIRAMAEVVEKEKKGYNYNYADITTILAKITTGMKKYGVSLIPQITPGTACVEKQTLTNTKTDRQGKTYDSTTTEMLVTADMIFRWINDDNPEEFIDVPWFVLGSQSDPSQAFGSALTYCTRYFLTSFFEIAQSDSDVDTYRSKQREAEAAEEKAITEDIIKHFDALTKEYISRNEDRVELVKKFISKYVKNSNYFAIKDSRTAAKLLQDFKKEFNVEEENDN